MLPWSLKFHRALADILNALDVRLEKLFILLSHWLILDLNEMLFARYDKVTFIVQFKLEEFLLADSFVKIASNTVFLVVQSPAAVDH